MARVFAVAGAGAGAALSIDDITGEACAHSCYDGHEAVLRVSEPVAGLEALIALHDTALGPALGGTRIWPYENGEQALADVLQLSRGMTLKAAMAGIARGGGSAVIIADLATEKTDALLLAYGQAVERLAGRFVTGEDVGLTVRDVGVIASGTRHVLGTSERCGDPARATALGVHLGIRTAVRHRLGRGDLAGVRVAVQGLGSVGRRLARRLAADGAVLTVTDADPERARRIAARLDAEAVAPDDIYDVDGDVFAPCALGGVINDDTLKRLRFSVVAGAANNQLLAPHHGVALDERGILYAPDYVINAGGLIALSLGVGGEAGTGWESARQKVSGIAETLDAVFRAAADESLPPGRIAERMAYERISAAFLRARTAD